MKRGSLRCPIPDKDRNEMLADPYYKRCCLADGTCEGRVQFHHALTYAGKRIPDKWAILPVCVSHHRREASFREEQKRIILSRYKIEDIKIKYPKIIL